MSETFKPWVVLVNCHGSVILSYSIEAKRCMKHNALGYRSNLALCLTLVKSSQARCPATALILRLYCPVCVRHGRNTKLLVFSCKSSFGFTTVFVVSNPSNS